MVIAIAGKIGNGKDTVGSICQYLISKQRMKLQTLDTEKEFNEFLKSNYNEGNPHSEIKKFAYKLKETLSILTGIPIGDFEKEEVKNSVMGEEWWYWEHPIEGLLDYNSNPNCEFSEKYKLIKPTYRQVLQEIGTELFRDKFHPNTWVNALFVDYKLPFNNSNWEKYLPIWIITDLRFPNELERIRKEKGITIRVIRENQSDKFQKIDNDGFHKHPRKEHYSEVALDGVMLDYTIDNNGTIEELIEKVKEILIKEKII